MFNWLPWLKPAVSNDRDVIAECMRIVKGDLDKGDLRLRVSEYWSDSGAYNYEKTWRPRLQLISEVISEGEIRLPRVLSEVLRRLEKKRNEDIQPYNYVSFNEKVSLPQIGGGYLHRGVVVRSILELCSSETECILELGSGWGEHLCNLWLAGGPEKAEYHACELSENGRKCALVLAALDENFKLSAPHFNYVEPRFDFLGERRKEMVVYSVHSAEQVPEVAPNLIEMLCDQADVVKGMHMEPIGWQMIPSENWNEITSSHHERCIEKNYNQNLWDMLKRSESKGLIAIDKAIPNFFGLDHNPASLVLWHKR